MKIITILFLMFLSLTHADTKPFRVTVIAPLTGPVAEYGMATKNGILLAQEEMPERLKNIIFSFEDSQYDPKVSLTAYRSIVSAEKADLIISWGSTPSSPIVPLAEKACRPLIAIDFTTSVLNQKKCVIGFGNSTTDLGKTLAHYLNSKGFKKLGVLQVENSYIEGLLTGLKESLAKDQSLTIISKLEPTSTDISSAVALARRGGYNALGIFLYPGQISATYRKLEEQKITIPTFGSDFFESKTEISASGPAIEGAVYAHIYSSPEFSERYTKKHGNDLQLSFAGVGYDLATLLGSLFPEGKSSMTDKEVIEKIKDKTIRTGVMGTYSYEDRTTDGPRYRFVTTMKTIKDGNYFNLEKE